MLTIAHEWMPGQLSGLRLAIVYPAPVGAGYAAVDIRQMVP